MDEATTPPFMLSEPAPPSSRSVPSSPYICVVAGPADDAVGAVVAVQHVVVAAHAHDPAITAETADHVRPVGADEKVGTVGPGDGAASRLDAELLDAEDRTQRSGHGRGHEGRRIWSLSSALAIEAMIMP